MKVSVEEISVVKKKIHVEVPEDEVKKEVDSFYSDLKKKAKIKGFRPGKAPFPALFFSRLPLNLACRHWAWKRPKSPAGGWSYCS